MRFPRNGDEFVLCLLMVPGGLREQFSLTNGKHEEKEWKKKDAKKNPGVGELFFAKLTKIPDVTSLDQYTRKKESF